MRVDESGAHEAPVEIDDLRLGMQATTDVVIADPHDGVIGYGHRRRIWVRRRVDAAAEEQLRGHDGYFAGWTTGLSARAAIGADRLAP